VTQERKKPELLAPAGGMEQLSYALRFGADAVYLAADRFGLRQRASNFSLEELAAAVKIAHDHQSKAYVTCNAFMANDDLNELPAYLEAFEAAGVDAIIASDLAVFRLARKHAAHTALHVSTQASCSNIDAALMWQEMGAKRIVCAREMSLEAIASMRAALPSELELEVFVHGAMCMAVSGRCLISDHLNNRSANQGNCTQPCRWSYALEEESRPGEYFPIHEDERGTYIMNSKDLCMLEHLDALAATGVDSLKIEGRNKKAFYVATVVNAYRQVLDGQAASDFLPELETVSHRPYSTGFFFARGEQTGTADTYTQYYDWVAEAVCALEGGRYEVICRNRFYEGDELEVLSPHQPIRKFIVSELYYEGPGENMGRSSNENVSYQREPSTTAMRAMERYSFKTDVVLAPHDILRVKRVDPSKKN